METFPIVKRKDEAKYDSYRTKELILEIYDKMAEAIANGAEYQTILDPPPADPSVAHPWPEETIRKVASVAPGYPIEQIDQFICVASLALVEAMEQIPRDNHLDAILLLLHPQLCQHLLSQNEQAQFAQISKDFHIPSFSYNKPVGWAKAVSYLTRNEVAALAISDRAGLTTLSKGNSFDKFTSKWNYNFNEIMPYVIQAAEQLHQMDEQALIDIEIDKFNQLRQLELQSA
jgi:hypothetical protein